jgi:hypothetical protein
MGLSTVIANTDRDASGAAEMRTRMLGIQGLAIATLTEAL